LEEGGEPFGVLLNSQSRSQVRHNQQRKEEKKMITVWGLASGIGNTKGAAPGAFTWHDYKKEQDVQRKDWLHIVIIQKEKGE
jgi:hypothetical protein